jgi:hypothetical protein
MSRACSRFAWAVHGEAHRANEDFTRNATDREILQDAGKVSAEIAKAHAESEFEKYRIVQDRLFESDFDRMLKRIAASGNPGGESDH